MRHADEQLLTIPEAAARLRQTPGTIRRKIREGQLPALRLGTGPRAPFRIDALELEAFLFAEPEDDAA
jgi:excisionase family DNA binding protein